MMETLSFALHVARALSDPLSPCDVFALDEARAQALAPEVRRSLGERFLRDERCQALYAARHLDHLYEPFDIPALRRYPANSLGRVYAEMMAANGFDPENPPYAHLPPQLPGAEDPLMYFVYRLRKVHDVWHVVTGFGTDLCDELGLYCFAFAQGLAPAPPIVHGLAEVARRRDFAQLSRILARMTAGYAAGRGAPLLAGVEWESHWREDLAEVRRWLGVRAVAPSHAAPAGPYAVDAMASSRRDSA